MSQSLTDIILGIEPTDRTGNNMVIKVLKNRYHVQEDAPPIIELYADTPDRWSFGLRRYPTMPPKAMAALNWVLEREFKHVIDPPLPEGVPVAMNFSILTFYRKEDATLFKLFWM